MDGRCVALLILLGTMSLLSLTQADVFFIIAPDTFHYGNEETVSVNVLGLNDAVTTVDLYLQDYPNRAKTFSRKQVRVTTNNPVLVTMKVGPGDIPEDSLPRNHYVYLVAEVTATGFKKEAVVLVSSNSHYVFIQTDRALYTPRETVHGRVFTMDRDMRPDNATVRLDIVNPQGVVIDRKLYPQSESGIIDTRFTFPAIVMVGKWSLVASYGHQFKKTVTAQFEVKEYVLPTFSVKITAPRFLLPDDARIDGFIEAKHAYGEAVAGRAFVKFEVVKGEVRRQFLTTTSRPNTNGEYPFSVQLEELYALGEEYQFPNLDGAILHVEATVTDVYTGKSMTSITRNTVFAYSPYAIKFPRSSKYFKPALPYVLQIDSKYVNGKIAGNTAVQVSATATTAAGGSIGVSGYDNIEVTTDEEGRTHFTLDIPRDAQSLTVTVRTADPELGDAQQGRADLTIRAYSSPSNSFLVLRTTEQIVMVDQLLEAEVFITNINDVTSLNYMVIGRGKILYQRTQERLAGVVTTLRIRVMPEMSPSVRLLVYYVRGNDEVVADSVWVDVVNQCQNPVTLELNKQRYKPGENAHVKITGTPGSKVALLAVDQAVHILNDKNSLTQDIMFKRMDDFDLGCTPGGGSNNQGVFQDAGLTTINNAGLTVPQRGQEGCVAANSRKKRSVANSGNEEDTKFMFALIEENESDVQVRSIFSESLLFPIQEIGEQGELSQRVTFPDSITSWSLQAVGVSPTTGMCVAQASNVTVFKEYFLQLDMPYSAVSGEQIEVKATLYNYRNFPLRAIVYLEVEGNDGICYGARPGENTEAIRLTIPANKAKQVAWPIAPLDTGDFNIRVKVFTSAGGDIVDKTLHVVPGGIRKVETRSFPVDPNGERRTQTPADGNRFISIPLYLPAETVPGSAHCSVSITGELMGPVTQAVIDGDTFRNFIRPATGSGENTMIRLGPMVYVAKYLKETGQMTGEKEEQLYNLIRQGVQHVMAFRRPEGGFGAWTHNRFPPSSWLTAFVTKIFAQAREFNALADDPSDVICNAVEWMSQQQEPTGAYQDPFKVFHREMTGGVAGDITFTAYVLVAMLEANCHAETIQASKTRALTFLEGQLHQIIRPYQASIVAYALALANSARKSEANYKLREMVHDDVANYFRYWPASQKFANQAKPYWYTRQPSVIEIETAAYAVLAQIKNDDIAYATPIVNWLVTHRNTGRVFTATQDTVVGLQALSEYTIHTRGPDLDLRCTITSSLNSAFKRTIFVDQSNADVKQAVDVTSVLGGELLIDTVGEGVGHVQVELAYNVHDVNAEQCRFELTVSTEEFVPPAQDCDDMAECGSREDPTGRAGASSLSIRIRSCVKYPGDGETGVSILEVGLFTGFVPVTEDLEALIDARGIGRYELNDRSVLFYLDTVPKDNPVCISFTAERKHVVGMTHAVGISVYDYYEPSEKCTKFYHPEFQSPLLQKICVGDQCQCAEAKCGTCYSFEPFDEQPLVYQHLLLKSCSKGMNYVLKIVVERIDFDVAFEIVRARVVQAIKKGVEDIQGEQAITFFKKTGCMCPFLEEGLTYYVMGRDGMPFENEAGERKFKYMLDEGSYVIEYIDRVGQERGSVQWQQARDQHMFQRDLTIFGCLT